MKKISFNSVLGALGGIAGSASLIGVTLAMLAVPLVSQADTVKVTETAAESQTGSFVYTVEKGDTLWDITDKYLKDPFKWPRVWKNNPYIKNPHLIYPGDIVRVTPDGLEIISRKVKPVRAPVDVDSLPVVAVEGTEERVVKLEPALVPAPRVKGPTVTSNLMKRQGFVSDGMLSASGSIIESKKRMIIMGEGAEVFVTLKNKQKAVVGARYSIYRKGEKVKHPVTGKDIGYMVDILGSLVVTSSTGVIEARVDNSFKEIEVGSFIMPYISPVLEVELTESTSPVTGVVVAVLDSASLYSSGDIVYIDRGTDDGLGEGNVLRVYRDRESVVDPESKKKVALPPVNLGTMVVLDPGKNTSTCIILKGLLDMRIGDEVSTMRAE